MREIISEKLKEIEEKENVKVLYCAESGSRAWGFASPDSDYDVRFVYIRPKDFYLRLEPTRDVIEWQVDEVWDINGWDIQKALRLLYKSNPTLFEWNGSPVVYKITDEWERVAEIINRYFIKKSGLYHYLSMAKGNYREYLKGEKVRLKKYLYVLRPILACKWILSESTPPPMLFSELTEKYLDRSIKEDVEKLLEVKMNSPEIAYGDRIESINAYIQTSISDIENQLESLPYEKERNWEELNKIFLSMF